MGPWEAGISMEELGDISTLADPCVVARLKHGAMNIVAATK